MVRTSISTRGKNFEKMGLGEYWDPPPKGMTQTRWEGIYASPRQVDPRDCDWYPDSPWCGKSPFVNPFKEPFASLQAQPYVYECGIGVEISGTLAWIKTHTARVEYRFPGDCRNEPTKPPPPDFGDDIPKTLPPPSGFDRTDINDDEWVYAGISDYWVYENAFTEDFWVPGARYLIGESLEFDYQSTPYKISTLNFNAKVKVTGKYITKGFTFDWDENDNPINVEGYTNTTEYAQLWDGFDHSTEEKQYGTNGKLYRTYQYGRLKFEEKEEIPPPPYESIYQWFPRQGEWRNHLVRGRWGMIKKVYSQKPRMAYFVNLRGDVTYHCFGVLKESELGKNPYRKNPSPPPPEKKECCMQCCSPSQYLKNDNQDLSEVLAILRRLDKNLGTYPSKVSIFDEDETKENAQSKVIEFASVAQGLTRAIERIEKISKVIGIDVFPLKVPESLIEKVDNNIVDMVFDFFKPDEIKINNVMSLLVYMLKYQNSAFGHWQQKIFIKDVDATQPGDQSKTIVLPDIANYCRESLTLEMGIYKAVGLAVDNVVKLQMECASIKQELVKTLLTVKDMQQWMDYTTDERHLKVPVQVTVPEIKNIEITGNESEEERILKEQQQKAEQAKQNNLEKFLQPSETTITYEDWDGKNSLTDYLIHLATLIASSRGQR